MELMHVNLNGSHFLSSHAIKQHPSTCTLFLKCKFNFSTKFWNIEKQKQKKKQNESERE